jgi:N-methylhydantoinase A
MPRQLVKSHVLGQGLGMTIPIKIASDIGGTFTDIVLESGARRWSAKVLTTTDAPERGVIEGVNIALQDSGLKPSDIDLFVHGTTLATNALIERKGAATAFITTEGFRDVIEQGYEKRFDHYDLMIDRAEPLVPRHLRLTVRERLAVNGDVLIDLDETCLPEIANTIIAENIRAVAIGFLHSYAHNAHERRVATILRNLLPDHVTICLSCEVAPEIREYERFSTTVANAYVRPLMSGYLQRLQQSLVSMNMTAPIFLMMSGGGLTTPEIARRFPIRLVESGPAGGAILAGLLARQSNLKNVLSFDMGGTTAKICFLKNGEPERSHRFEVARAYRDLKGSGLPVRIPVIEMVEIGAGGGSIARVDQMQRLTVGPDSAGSNPGPVAYQRGGTRPTVTDANICLGKIDPEFFAGGKIALDLKASEKAVQDTIGKPLEIADMWPAAGIAEIVEENMAAAARVHAIERGVDISQTAMIAFGGGAPLHACRLAEKIGIHRVLVPVSAGVGSAVGFLRAPVSFEVTRSSVLPLHGFDPAKVNALIASMRSEAETIVASAVARRSIKLTIVADCRYIGQGHEIQISVPARALTKTDGPKLITAFEEAYRKVYGLVIPGQPVEAVTWSVTASSSTPSPQSVRNTVAAGKAKPIKKRSLFDAAKGKVSSVPVYWREDLERGAKLQGPAIIAEQETSTIVTSTFNARIDSVGNIVMERKS